MPTYQCSVCKKIDDFPEKYDYLLKEKKCGTCGKVGQYKTYTGPMAESILGAEDTRIEKFKKQLVEKRDELAKTLVKLDKLGKDKEGKQQEYERTLEPTDQEVAAFSKQIEKFNADMVTTATELDKLRSEEAVLIDQIEDLGNRSTIYKDAKTAHDSASTVQTASGKNKLYIGSKDHVSSYVSKFAMKKKRILDVPNWSPGLNVSWVEGGIAAKAHFKIKLNPENQFHTIPETILQKFKDNPSMDPAEFYKLCAKEGKNTLLWYNKDGRNRPTWTALEIWCLLRVGYTFTFADSGKDGPGAKIVLVPPA